MRVKTWTLSKSVDDCCGRLLMKWWWDEGMNAGESGGNERRWEETESHQPRVFSASNHVEAGFALLRVGHTERQAGQLHWGRGGAAQEVQEEDKKTKSRRLKLRELHSCDWMISGSEMWCILTKLLKICFSFVFSSRWHGKWFLHQQLPVVASNSADLLYLSTSLRYLYASNLYCFLLLLH